MVEPRTPTKKSPTLVRRRAWSLLGMLALVALLAAGAAVFLSGASRQEPARVSGDVGERDLARRAVGPGDELWNRAEGGVTLDVLARGDEDAPVVMIEYVDFQCPFCGEFARDIEPYLVEEYVESGTLRIEWRGFPYRGQESVNAALKARAAQEQGKFWEHHDALYRNQGSPNSGAFADEQLVALAEEAGLNAERLAFDLTSGKYEGVVSDNFEEATSTGIPGTPAFFVNEKPLVGAQPVAAFEEGYR